MIQDISPHVFHNEFTSSAPESSDTVFVFGQRQVLAVWEHDGSIIFPKAGAFRKSVLRYLFRIDDRRYYLYLPESYEHEYEYEEKIPGTDGFDFIPMMDVRRSSDLAAMFACMTAYHLFTWYDRNRFCGRCGQPLQHAEAERMLCCPVCGNVVILGVFQLGIPYVLYAIASKDCSPLACSLIGMLEPLLNPVWVALFIGEVPGLYALCGAVIIIVTVSWWCVQEIRWDLGASRCCMIE